MKKLLIAAAALALAACNNSGTGTPAAPAQMVQGDAAFQVGFAVWAGRICGFQFDEAKIHQNLTAAARGRPNAAKIEKSYSEAVRQPRPQYLGEEARGDFCAGTTGKAAEAALPNYENGNFPPL